MTCSRGAASPDPHTQRRLFAASAGYCQNPACLRELFIDYPDKNIHVAEMAHVFAANDSGPRADAELSKEQRGMFDNLIMLCPLCHTIIDKAPDQYQDSTILAWKRNHAIRLQFLFGSTIYQNRSQARLAVDHILQENYRIFTDYGPHIAEAGNPESGAEKRWRRKMLEKIIPNSNRILAIIDNNKTLLSSQEFETLERFRQHVDDLHARHVEGYEEGASQFPKEMSAILKD